MLRHLPLVFLEKNIIMKKIIVFLLLSSFAYAGAIYIPCEDSIVNANMQLETKIKKTSSDINNKTNQLKEKYKIYLGKLKEYNERQKSYQILQREKNMLLLDVKNELMIIKNELYLGQEKDNKKVDKNVKN